MNHLPSFNTDSEIDEQIKKGLLEDMFAIIELSVEHRKAKETDLIAEKKQQQLTGSCKRISVQEHCAKVRFDPKRVETELPNNGFRLIFPR